MVYVILIAYKLQNNEHQKWIHHVRLCINTHPYLQYAAFEVDTI